MIQIYNAMHSKDDREMNEYMADLSAVPGLNVLWDDAPREIIIAVVTPRVVKEIRSRWEHAAGDHWHTLQDKERESSALYYWDYVLCTLPFKRLGSLRF